MTEHDLRTKLCEIGRLLWHRGLIGGAEGNLSLRLTTTSLLCTPAGFNKSHLDPDAIVKIDLDGNAAGPGVPSSEIKLHLGIYRQRADCKAVIHGHPPIATALTLAGENIPDNLMPESAIVLGPVCTVPFAMPGTEDVPKGLEPYLDHHKTFLLSHHGAVTLGRDLEDAYNRMETLERIAQMYVTAKSLGATKPMPDSAFQHILGTSLSGGLD